MKKSVYCFVIMPIFIFKRLIYVLIYILKAY